MRTCEKCEVVLRERSLKCEHCPHDTDEFGCGQSVCPPCPDCDAADAAERGQDQDRHAALVGELLGRAMMATAQYRHFDASVMARAADAIEELTGGGR